MPSEVKNILSIDGWWLGVLSYAVCHCLHILVWHLRLFRPGLKLLIVIFFIVPGISYGIALVYGAPFLTAAIITHLLLTANYFAAYPAIQASSPTLVILDALYRNPDGFRMPEIMALFDTTVVTDRLSELELAGLIKQNENEYTLTLKGNALASFFATYRKILGYTPGEG